MSDEKRFAFGEFESYKTGAKCPIRNAEPITLTSTATLIKEFDRRAKVKTGEKKGTLPESEAKEIWFEMIEQFEANPTKAGYSREHSAKEVARELGWCDD